MTYRRAPSVVASVANTNALADEVDPVYGYLDERSCSSVSVNGRHVTGINETTPVIPASNQKLLVAAVALEMLGPEFTFTTRLTGPAPVDGVIDGDVVIVGGGDPLLTSSDYPIANDSDPAINVTTFDQLADQLVAAGVTRINGSVLGDGSRYDDEYEVDSWGEGVAGVEAGPYDALMVNDSRTLGRSGKQPDPNAAAAREFVRLLGERGITVSGGWDAGVADPAAAELASIQSAPLDAVVAEMLTTSDDNTAELMLKELGVADSATGTAYRGRERAEQHARLLGRTDGRRPSGRRVGIEPGQPCHLCRHPRRAAAFRRFAAAGGSADRRADRHAGRRVRGHARGRPTRGEDRDARQRAGHLRSALGQGAVRVPARRERRRHRVHDDPQLARTSPSTGGINRCGSHWPSGSTRTRPDLTSPNCRRADEARSVLACR